MSDETDTAIVSTCCGAKLTLGESRPMVLFGVEWNWSPWLCSACQQEIGEQAEIIVHAEPITRTSVACRTCHAGWYGSAGGRCPRCGARVVVTGEITVVDLR